MNRFGTFDSVGNVFGSRLSVFHARGLSIREDSECLQTIKQPLVPRIAWGALRYFESGTPFIVARSTGIDTCSCAISHWPFTFLYPSVTRTVRFTFLPFLSVVVTD